MHDPGSQWPPGLPGAPGPWAEGPTGPGTQGKRGSGTKVCRDPWSQDRLAICFKTPLLMFITFWALLFERGREGRPSLKANAGFFFPYS